MRLALIPVCNACQIILTLKKAFVADPDLLYGYFQIFVKIDWIRDMPAVKTPHWRAVIIVIRIMYQFIMCGIIGVAQIW